MKEVERLSSPLTIYILFFFELEEKGDIQMIIYAIKQPVVWLCVAKVPVWNDSSCHDVVKLKEPVNEKYLFCVSKLFLLCYWQGVLQAFSILLIYLLYIHSTT